MLADGLTKHFQRGPLRSTVRSGALLGDVVEGQNAIKKVACGPKARDLVVEPSTFIWSTNQKFQGTVLRISAGDVSTLRRPK